MDRTWHVYLLRCADGTLYTGVTTDPDRRLAEHNRGTASRYTRGRRPVEMVHREACGNRSEALRREAAVKGMSRVDKLCIIKSKENDT
jgi:putative endonuclease